MTQLNQNQYVWTETTAPKISCGKLITNFSEAAVILNTLEFFVYYLFQPVAANLLVKMRVYLHF